MIVTSATRGLAALTRRLFNPLITHKFYFGQGGQLQFDLTNRNYHIEVQTFWEDYSEL
jgi:hypothetical protein